MGKSGGPSAALLIGAAIAALLLLGAGAAQAAQDDAKNPPPPYPPPLPPDGFVTGDGMGFDTPSGADLDSQLSAFLYMIRSAEHVPAAVRSGRDYATFYGGAQFRNFADHPVITGEMQGVPLSDSMCRAAGLGPGCVSTAAGAYQIIKPTWDRVRAAGKYGPRLPDFSPASQDEAARRLLIECGALAQLNAGNVPAAIQKAGKLWASLPGSTAGQHPKSMETALAYFANGGGVA
jgi:lysozyme